MVLRNLTSLALLLIALVGTSASALPSSKAPKIGLLLPLTGLEASGGEDCRQGLEVAYQYFARDKSPVEIIYADSKLEAKTGINEYRRLTDIENVLGIVSFSSRVSMPLNPLSSRDQVPLFGLVGHTEFVSGNPYAFRFWPNSRNEGEALADKLSELGHSSISMVTMDDEWLLSLTENLRRKFKENGGKVLFDEVVTSLDADFKSIVTRVKRAQADSVLVNVFSDQIGPLVKQLREQGVDSQLASSYLAQRKGVVETAGRKALRGLLFPEIDIDRPKFRQAIKETFPDAKPTAATYTCYAALGFALEALRRSEDIGAFYRNLVQTEKVPLLDEVLVIKEREAQYSVVVKKVN